MNGYPDYMGYTQPGGYQSARYQSQMQYNYPQIMQNNGMMGQTQQGGNVQILRGRPVSSFDEAKACMIDLDGSLFVFTDIANKKIYTKRGMLDGTAELKTYVLVDEKQHEENTLSNMESDGHRYVLHDEFDKVLKQINRRFDDMEGMINEPD